MARRIPKNSKRLLNRTPSIPAVVAGLLLQATTLGCATEDTPKSVAIAKSALARTTTPSSDNLAALGASNRAFAADLYHAVAAEVPAYLDVLALNYGAGVFLTDFAGAPEAARHAINGWVEDKTEKLIPELLKPRSIDGNTRLVLTNTVYFNASWATKFDKAQTQSQPFHKLDGTDVSVPTMGAGLTLPYAEGDNYRAIALPYEGDQLRFVAVLPNEGAFAAVEAGLSADWFAALDSAWHPTGITLRLPLLDYKQSTSLKDSLKALGVHDAFTPAADFSGMTADGLYISDVLHEAVLKVFEGGTIAAAATAVVFGRKSALEFEQTMIFDRPFLFSIIDQPTGAVLFLGRVLDPSQK